MIRTREELIMASNQWLNVAMKDLKNQMISFINKNGTSEEELADALAISIEDVENILNESGTISLLTFAKLLIATENVIEIKPLKVAQKMMGDMRHFQEMFGDRNERQQPKRGRRGILVPTEEDMRHFQEMFGDRNERQQPQRGRRGIPVPTEEDMRHFQETFDSRNERQQPQRTTRGVPVPTEEEMKQHFQEMFGGRNERQQPQRGRGNMPRPTEEEMRRFQEMQNEDYVPFGGIPLSKRKKPNQKPLDMVELDELGKIELSDIIHMNKWDDEIDVSHSKRSDIINFINSKVNKVNDETEASLTKDEKDKIIKRILEDVSKNPHLVDKIRKTFNI